jgi:hypothetical protein
MANLDIFTGELRSLVRSSIELGKNKYSEILAHVGSNGYPVASEPVFREWLDNNFRGEVKFKE